jgi:creatinine amidohydrolase/Fe(II)-dependent formamide hydrolase-like protein
MEQVEYRCLLPHQFAGRFRRMPLAYLPVGSLEWHGEHLCLGNDGVKIEEICKRAALRGGGIVLPCIYYAGHSCCNTLDAHFQRGKGYGRVLPESWPE